MNAIISEICGEPVRTDARTGPDVPYRDVVEASVQGIAILHDERVRYVNPAAARMFGYASPADVVGLAWASLVAPEDVDLVRERVAACLHGATVAAHPGWQGIRRDGARFWVESFASLLTWNGQPAVLALLRDITQQRRLEEQLRHAQKMEAIGRLAGGVAHDFNNLLTVIIGCTNLALNSLPDSDSTRHLLEQVQTAGERAAVLTRQLLGFSRKEVARPVATDLNVLLAGIEKLLVRLLGEDLDLRLRLCPSLWRVNVDPGQIEQVVMNLAVNARDAMPDGGTLSITTSNIAGADVPAGPGGFCAPDCVLLTVSDTGCGMDEATRERMFEPFFTTKTPDKGTGLGLATVYSIVQQHGGTVSVATRPGRGTTIKVHLPGERFDAPGCPSAPGRDR